MSLTTLLVIMAVALAVLVIVWMRGSSRDAVGPRTCRQCGTTQPPPARFCRKCGRAV